MPNEQWKKKEEEKKNTPGIQTAYTDPKKPNRRRRPWTIPSMQK